MDRFNELKDLIASIDEDAVKFYENGNAAAGTRVRKALQQAKTLAQDIRNDVTARKNAK